MGIIQKQAILSTVISYTGAVIGFVTVGVLQPNLLSLDENGLLKLLVSVSTLFAQFGNLGVNAVIMRFFPYFRNKENKHHGFLFYPAVVSLIGFVLCTTVFLLFKEKIIEKNIEKSALFVTYLMYLVPLTFFTLYFNILDSYCRSLFNSITGLFLKEVLQRILILILIVLYYFGILGFNGFVISYVTAICLPTVILIIFLIQRREWSLKPNLAHLNRPMAFDMVKLALFSILGGVSSTIISTIDSVMINDALGLGATGIYGITFYFGTLIIIPARSIGRISSTIIAEAWKNDDLDTINRIYHKSCSNQLIIGSLLLIGIWGNIDNILKFLPPDFASGKYVILFIGLGNLIDMATGVNSTIIASSKYYRYDTFFMAALVGFTVITNYIFLPLYGITGSAIASALTLTGFNLMRYIFLWKKFGMQPYNMQTLVIIGIGLLTYGICYLVPALPNFIIDILVRSTVITIVFVSLIIWSRSSEEINGMVKKLVSKVRARK